MFKKLILTLVVDKVARRETVRLIERTCLMIAKTRRKSDVVVRCKVKQCLELQAINSDQEGEAVRESCLLSETTKLLKLKKS